MTKVIFLPVFLFFTLFLRMPVSFAHGPCSAFFPRFLTNEQKTELEKKFKEDADYLEAGLLLKTIEYHERHPWFHEVLLLEGSGDVYYGCPIRITTEKASETAKLDEAYLNRIKQKLVQLNTTTINGPPPYESKLVRGNPVTVLVFHDGKTLQRYVFNGRLPAQVQEIISLIMSELKRQTELKLKFMAPVAN